MTFQRVLSNTTAVRLIIAAAYMTVLIVVGTILFSIFEGLSHGDSFYLTIQTMFSIGYGDIPPSTERGKILTTLLIIFGISGFLASVSIIGADIFNKYSSRAVKLTAHLISINDEKKDATHKWAEKYNIDARHIDRVWSELPGGNRPK